MYVSYYGKLRVQLYGEFCWKNLIRFFINQVQESLLMTPNLPAAGDSAGPSRQIMITYSGLVHYQVLSGRKFIKFYKKYSYQILLESGSNSKYLTLFMTSFKVEKKLFY